MSSSDQTPREMFDNASTRVRKVVTSAVILSESNIGVHHTGRQNRALFLFAKMIAHTITSVSIINQFKNSPKDDALLDHFSMATLSRAVIDAGLMIMYISHPTLTRDQWNLRRYVLYLHDSCNRKRFLTAIPNTSNIFLDSYEESKPKLVEKIRHFSKNLKIPNDKVLELVKGQMIFVDGARGAVREAGWDLKHYDFQQSYLSAYVHSHPVSFMRADDHKISFTKPSDFQFGFSALVTDIAAGYLESVTERMTAFSDREQGDPLGQVDD